MISRKPVLEYSLNALLHPASMAAMLLLLLNDHLLRLHWPSWWTGKLGDFAWLFFAPLACTVLLFWLAPPSLQRRPACLGGAGFSLVAAFFILAKTYPPFHVVLVNAAQSLLGAPISLRRDPTDLLALPSLIAAAWLWLRNFPPSAVSRGEHSTLANLNHANRQAQGLAALGFAALLTIANAGYPEAGIVCLDLLDGQIFAGSIYRSYLSQDSGRTWQMQVGSGADTLPGPPSECRSWSRDGKDIPDLRQPGLRYRYLPGLVIQKSTDDGRTWQSIYDLAPASQLEQAYYSMHGYNSIYHPGPMDLLVLPESGDVLFAMGFEGLLHYQPVGGSWEWIPVDEYRRVDFHGPGFTGTVLGMLTGELFLALAFGALVSLTAYLRRWRGRWRFLGLLAGWIVFLGSLYLKPALNVSAYGALPELAAFFLLALLLLPLTIVTLIAAARRTALDAVWLVVTILLSAGLFFLPFFLWGQDLIPAYEQAAWLGGLLGLLPGVGLFVSLRKTG